MLPSGGQFAIPGRGRGRPRRHDAGEKQLCEDGGEDALQNLEHDRIQVSEEDRVELLVRSLAHEGGKGE